VGHGARSPGGACVPARRSLLNHRCTCKKNTPLPGRTGGGLPEPTTGGPRTKRQPFCGSLPPPIPLSLSFALLNSCSANTATLHLPGGVYVRTVEDLAAGDELTVAKHGVPRVWGACLIVN
jgi:hypothetical protein